MALNLAAGIEPVPGYVLVRLLGRGGFGEVWEALAPGDVRVALKFVRLDTAGAGPEQRALAVIRDIRHPHLLDLQFAAHVDDCLVLAMPLCERTLADRFRQCRDVGLCGIPLEELLGYMEDLARAVDFLNEPRHEVDGSVRVGIQHRDIKPNNIFLVGDSVRLADFGLAKVLAASGASHTGAMSPNYVAPEVIEGRVSSRSDQYSLAVTYVQLRVGRLPFSGDSIHNLLYAHLQEPPELAGMPEEEQASVMRALAKRPEDRWPSCRAFVSDLKQAAGTASARLSAEAEANEVAATLTGFGGSPPGPGSRTAETVAPAQFHSTHVFSSAPAPIRPVTTTPGPPPAAPRPRRRRLLVLGGLALACAAPVGLWLAPRPGPALPSTAGQPASEFKPVARPASASLPEPEPDPAPAAAKDVADPASKKPIEPRTREAEAEAPSSPAPRPKRPVAGEPITNSIGMALALLPGGRFVMTATDPGPEDTRKAEVRTTRPFYLGVREVTQREYEQVMNDNPSKFSPHGDFREVVAGQDTREYPVENITWKEAIAFCDRLSEREGLPPYYGSGRSANGNGTGYRLPTEVEWEYACRAGSQSPYAFGNDESKLGDYAWFAGNAGQQTHPGGQKLPNAFGLYDMHGNVWEWCWDEFRLGGSSAASESDPSGSLRASDRIYRGGGYYDGPRGVRATSRSWGSSAVRDAALGFRVARGAGDGGQ